MAATTPPATPAATPHSTWLDGEAHRLVDFARGARHPAAGFAPLDEHGRPQLDKPVETWLTARMTHVFAIGELLGMDGCADLTAHGVTALTTLLHDDEHGGWHSRVDPATGVPSSGRKECYQHAFVVLAASSASQVGAEGARELLDEALGVLDARFWDPTAGAHRETFAADWSDDEAYRGANSNMHAVEALLAASDATGDVRWRERALTIASHIVDDVARTFGWRLVEHFDTQWKPLPTYNEDNKADQFRPYGLTIGHWLEWSRLLLHLDAALPDAPPWLGESAAALFANAVDKGWAVDGADGFVYTIGWDDAPVVRERMHWVVAEGIGAAAAVKQRFGGAQPQRTYVELWDYARDYLIDLDDGSWHHELDAHNRPAATVWPGKPDIYHALQATLIPRLPLAPSLVAALRAGLLDTVAPPEGASA